MAFGALAVTPMKNGFYGEEHDATAVSVRLPAASATRLQRRQRPSASNRVAGVANGKNGSTSISPTKDIDMTRLGLPARSPARRKKTTPQQGILSQLGKMQTPQTLYRPSGPGPGIQVAPAIHAPWQPSVGLPAGMTTSLEPMAPGPRRPMRGPSTVFDRPGTAVGVRQGLQQGAYGAGALELTPGQQESLVQREVLVELPEQKLLLMEIRTDLKWIKTKLGED